MKTSTLPTSSLQDLSAQVLALRDLGFSPVGEVEKQLVRVDRELVMTYKQEMEISKDKLHALNYTHTY